MAFQIPNKSIKDLLGIFFCLIGNKARNFDSNYSIMKKVKEETPNLTAKTKSLLQQIDFADTFSTTNHVHSLEEIANKVFNYYPKWLELLFLFRNNLVKLLGLKTKIPDDYHEDFVEGGYIKFFRIYDISENELILGLNDEHLNFRAIIFRNQLEHYNIKMTTIVEYNNKTGKLYMSLIKPFHRWVVRAMLKKAWI